MATKNKKPSGPRILLLDIETAPILANVWRLFDENVGLDQIKNDWHVLAWSAKWLNEKNIFYYDQRDAKNIEDDKNILIPIWNLMDEADIVVTQNGVSFDIKKLNARFIINGMKPPSGFRNVDTKLIAKKKFSFTSNKLEYLSDKLCTKYKKLSHSKFPGFLLWKEVINGNMKAWKEMERYNKHDVLALEELYKKLIPWDTSINHSVYTEDLEHVCSCGSSHFKKKGYGYTSVSKFQRYICLDCGAQWQGRENLISINKRKTILK